MIGQNWYILDNVLANLNIKQTLKICFMKIYIMLEYMGPQGHAIFPQVKCFENQDYCVQCLSFL